ncbi:SRPBCC family protein [Azospirillum sp. 412522]|nr:SRPBCC family protein [Azospirillum sp. 412522]MBY6265472.1 SRPBCC family protein [Azospirillum sp. 412522]
MPLVTATTLLPVPARRVWPLVRWDGAVADWYPGAVSVTVDGTGKGALRRLWLYDGSPVIHRLEHVSRVGDAYTYAVIEGPYPVADLLAQIRLGAGGEGQAVLHWTATFHPLSSRPNGTEMEGERFVRDLYDAGMARLRALLHP